MATDPTGRVSHLPEMHRGVSWKQPCRVATTANITISTALNNGDTIDGVTLATGDRVLVKDQTSGAENGIYVVAASPTRDYDMDQDASSSVPASEVLGAFIYIIAGTANGGKVFRVTNTTAPTLGSTSLTFTEFTSGSSGGLLAIEGGQDTIMAHGSMGSTETFDPTDGNVHTGTLNADCTFTLNAPSGSGAATLEFWITQDGTGGWGITWPGSVTADGSITPDTTAGVTVRYLLETLDGGTNWLLNLVGSAASGGGSGFGQIVRVKRTAGDLTTTSTTFVDATSLTTTLTTGATRCLVTFSAMGNCTATGTLSVDVAVDGTLQGGTYGLVGAGSGGGQHNFSFTFWTDVLSAASHTIKLQWKVDTGTGTLYASSVSPAIFTVAETNLTT